MNKLRFPFLCSNYKTFSHLNLKLKQRLFVVDGRFENRGISLGCYSWILPSLPAAGGYLGYMLCLDRLCMSKNNCQIIIAIICNTHASFFSSPNDV